MIFKHYFDDESLPYSNVRVSSGRIVPLISSYSMGNLGLAHLPRLWQKGILYAIDALAEGYGYGPGGIDLRLMKYIDLQPEPFVRFIAQECPTYPQCEQWVKSHARNLDGIDPSNKDLLSTPLRGNLGDRFRACYGIDDPTVSGVMLNNVDDWATVHAYVMEHGDTRIEPIVPAISSTSVSPRGIMHVPRLWLNGLLAARNALPNECATWTADLDAFTLDNLGVSAAASRAFIESARPSYLQYEAWILTAGSRVDREVITAHNRALQSRRQTREAIQQVKHNDFRDWAKLHRDVRSRRDQLHLPPRMPPMEVPAGEEFTRRIDDYMPT